MRTLKTAAIAEALLAAGPQRSFSRSLSSEHSLAGVSESYKNGITNGLDTQVDESDEDVEVLKDELEDLRQKVQGLEELRREHAKLTENYNESMDLLDELKSQLQRPPPSPIVPVSPMRPGLIRSRSISDLKMVQMNDRATRALDTLSQKIVELGGDDEDLRHSSSIQFEYRYNRSHLQIIAMSTTSNGNYRSTCRCRCQVQTHYWSNESSVKVQFFSCVSNMQDCRSSVYFCTGKSNGRKGIRA